MNAQATRMPSIIPLGVSEMTLRRDLVDNAQGLRLLAADASQASIRQLCDEARTYGFKSVCVNSANVPLAVECLAGAPSLVCAVVGFPLGAGLSAAKAHEAELAIQAGAREIDMVGASVLAPRQP